MNKFIAIIVGAIILLSGGVWWSKSLQSKDTNIIATKGIHWHPEVEIYVKGEKVVIDQNIGIGAQYSALPMGMAPLHTHDDIDKNIIHLEFGDVVRKEDTVLNQFFKNWGKDIDSFGTLSSMTVNGVENTELGSYQMKDGDKIVLRYE